MKRIVLISSAMMALGTITASAQMPKLNAGIMSKIKSAMAKVIKKESTIVGNVATTGMDLKTTRPCKTTSYDYVNGAWQWDETTLTEYNSKGYVTATVTEDGDGKIRTENTYDDKLDGFVTKVTEYTWDAATSTWTNPTVVMSVELTRDEKGHVTKETIYSLDKDTKTLVNEGEYNFVYDSKTGELYSLSTVIEEKDEESGEVTSVPLLISVQKWYKYNPNKIFDLGISDLEGDMLGDTENMIEKGTISITVMNIPIIGTIRGEYTDTKSTITVKLNGILNVTMSNEKLDDYGSNRTDMTISSGTYNTMVETITETNNEHGDCIKVVSEQASTTGAKAAGIGDIDTDMDGNYTLTMDYEYLETTSKPAYDFMTGNNGFIKKSMVVNRLDAQTNTFSPIQKVTYDEYVDYVSGATGIDKVTGNASENQNKTFYRLDGTKVGNQLNSGEKGVYIVKEGGRTYKVAK